MSEPWHPQPHQKKSIRYGLSNGAAGFLLDPGLGKTSIALAIHKILRREGLITRSLIVAPLRPMRLTWPAEIEKWDDFKHMKYRILHGDHKNKAVADMEEDESIELAFINPEGLYWYTQEHRYERVGADCLIVDEISKFKNPQTGRFKTLKPLLNTFHRRYGLTGSPAPNSYLDLFGIAYLLDFGNTLGQYITQYRTRFFVPTGMAGYDWKLVEGAEKEIHKLIKPLFLRLDADDYLKLPELVNNDIYVELDDESRAVYDHMEEEMFAVIAKGTATAVSAGASSMKCRQIANGTIYLDGPVSITGKRVVGRVHEEKIAALRDLVEELEGSPLLIAYQFQHDLEAIQDEFPDMPYMGSGVSAKREKELERAWNAGELLYLAGQSGAISHGLNLQKAANHVCWFGLTWNYEDYDQLIRRVRRQGNKATHVFNHRILARNTVDMAMKARLSTKETTQKNLLDALRAYRKTKRA